MGFFEKMFGGENLEQKPERTLYPGMEPDAKRLMGLREFDPATPEEEKEMFKSDDRLAVYNNMAAETGAFGRQKVFKKAIVREIIRNGLIPDETLRQSSTVYLGSGADIEYPLALGARDIWMIDPILSDEDCRTQLKSKLEGEIKEKLPEELRDQFSFNFDFGNGDEVVKVTLVPKAYGVEGVELPEKIGLVLKFASQGPSGEIVIGKDIEDRAVDGGVELTQATMAKVQNGKKEITELGR